MQAGHEMVFDGIQGVEHAVLWADRTEGMDALAPD